MTAYRCRTLVPMHGPPIENGVFVVDGSIIVEAGSNVTNNTINRIIGANLFGLEVNCPSLITNNAVTGYLPFGMPITFGSGGASKCVLTNNLED